MTHIILYAPNVHTGGGAVLLKELLKSTLGNQKVTAILDSRIRSQLKIGHIKNISIRHWVKPTIRSRICAELILAFIDSNAKIFCFHNIPPILNISNKTVVFFQNRLIIQGELTKNMGYRTWFVSNIERIINIIFQFKVQYYIVQSCSMKSSLMKSFLKMNSSKVQIIPFIPSIKTDRISDKNNKWDFIYPSSGDTHKNHKNLIQAWELLALENIFPTLALTIGKNYKDICTLIDKSRLNSHTEITNLGALDYEMALEMYQQTKSLIFPSKSESFGLPLVEASIMGIPILASESDFVRDVCKPVETFDPNSPVSIARAVKRFLGINEKTQKAINAKQFWERLQ